MMFLRQRMLLEERAQGTVRACLGARAVCEAECLYWDPKNELLEPWPGLGGLDQGQEVEGTKEDPLPL